MYDYSNLIDGEWITGEGDAFETLNPARPAEVVGRYSGASARQITVAVQAASAAQRAWRRSTAVERFAAVEAFVTGVLARAEELAVSITREQGKPLAESRGEVAKSCAEARIMAAQAFRSQGDVMPSARPGIRNMVVRRPRGVIAAITPWNFPILTPMRKIVPAIAFGNAVILKPSEFTPSTACILAEVAQALLPRGIVQVVNGKAAAGSHLVRHKEVAGVTFTGSVPTGKAIFAATADTLAELSLELGGKNAAVVNDAGDLGACLDQITGAACMCAGQRCTAISRVLVRRDLYAATLDGLASRFNATVLGDGMNAGTTMGPLVNAAQLAKVDAMVNDAVRDGARVVCGGSPAKIAGCDGGYFYAPTVLADVDPAMRIAREEVFGPVLVVLAFDSIDHALGMLNDVDFGLTSAIFSEQNTVVQRFIDESENGMIHVNHGTIPDNHMPFGGIRNSGVGAYSVGPSAINFFTTEHSVYIKGQ